MNFVNFNLELIFFSLHLQAAEITEMTETAENAIRGNRTIKFHTICAGKTFYSYGFCNLPAWLGCIIIILF